MTAVPHTEALTPRFRELVPEDAVVEQISSGHLFTEGPVWVAREGALLWSDIAGDTIWKWTPGGGRAVFLHPSGKANGLTLDRQGRLVAAGWTSRRVWRMEPDGRIVTLATHYRGVKIGTPNDIVVRSDGSIYWTDGTSGARHPGFETSEDLQIYRRESVVLRWHPDTNEVTLVTDQAGSCNGIAFSHDERILYVNDSSARTIRAFDVAADGTVTGGRVFAENTGSATKVDRHGNVFCTGAAGVHVLDASGTLLGRINVPAKTSNLAWGEDDWRTLFVTGGPGVFRIRVATEGVPVG
ncbi:MAG TPA: SMP-30/gluconolactonase/LRE family protein [Candidatus Limnocylindria bacterium]|nr:SMP-30/gluconolactonase/LRE family protein [Candidatus Limnocylindria bacterium]